jgi:hypothetical protein
MSDDWAKKLADKIADAGEKGEKLDLDSSRIVKLAEKARAISADMLFRMFIDRLDAVRKHLEEPESGKRGFFQLFRKSQPSILTHNISHEQTFRFQNREAWGSRMEIDFARGAEPRLTINVGTHELIHGEYLPIFRDSGAIAGAQIWQQRLSEKKHPNLIARIILIMSVTALDEGLEVEDAMSWVYEDDLSPIKISSIEEMIEALIAAA